MNDHDPTVPARLNIEIKGRRTSFSLEAGVWDALTQMCRDREQSMDELCEEIVENAGEGVSMASAIRTAVLQHFMDSVEAA